MNMSVSVRSIQRISGFTLIELLVVIAIIALLVGIMFPALSAARESSIQTKCMSQMRQMAAALTMYAIDDPGASYPRARMMNTGNTWLEDITQYISTNNFFRCPADDSELWPTSGGTRFTSFGINAYLTNNHPPYEGMSLEKMYNASATIAIAELADDQVKDHFMPMVWGDPIAWPSVLPGMNMGRMNEWDNVNKMQRPVEPFRHMSSKSNYAYADGHGQLQRFNQTWYQVTGDAREVDRYDPNF